MSMEEQARNLGLTVFFAYLVFEFSLSSFNLGLTTDTAVTQFVNEIPGEFIAAFTYMGSTYVLLLVFSYSVAGLVVFGGYVVNRLLIWHKCRKPVRVYTPQQVTSCEK